MPVNRTKSISFVVVILLVLALSSCAVGRLVDPVWMDAAGHVSAASVNVYTGTLLDIDLYDEGVGIRADTYAIKVQVKEVFKGNFTPGEIVEDLCPAGFSQVNCDYLFMTGVDPSFGYDRNTYNEAENVYSGKVLKVEPYVSVETDLPDLHAVTVEVKEVFKGNYQPGDVIEDITSGRLEEINDDVIFMTSKDNLYLGRSRLEATDVVYNRYTNPYSMVKLLGDNRIEFSKQLDLDYVYYRDILPPTTYDELIQQVQKPIGYSEKPFFPDSVQ